MLAQVRNTEVEKGGGCLAVKGGGELLLQFNLGQICPQAWKS